MTLSSCIVEVFGDTRVIECGDWHAANPRVTRRLRLLNLRGHGAMRAGTVAAIGKTPDRSLSQDWSRYFYEAPIFRQCDGLIFFNAHNDEAALALYERAEDALECGSADTIRLDDTGLRPYLQEIARKNGLVFVA